MENCIFCRIVEKQIPSKIVYEDENVLAFHDIDSKAPVHILIIPKEHIPSLNDVNQQNSQVIAHIFSVIVQIAENLGVKDSGYRVVTNCGSDAGQSVNHLHFHVLGGRSLTWPPG
ncbi:MAG: histidine triad nucleotide-binding protein [Clostridiales bacterium]|nr:histidine triad nucleotide-binding protein [Clostridiales bacterium]